MDSETFMDICHILGSSYHMPDTVKGMGDCGEGHPDRGRSLHKWTRSGVRWKWGLQVQSGAVGWTGTGGGIQEGFSCNELEGER